MMSRHRRCIVAVALWLAAIALAAMLDRTVATWVREVGLDGWMRSHKLVEEILKAPGTYYFTAAVAIAVAIVHPLRWSAAGFVLLATVVSGMNGLVKWIAGRTRPFKLEAGMAQPFELSPFRGGLGGLFESKNLCFPSGHAALAFATAAAVAMLWPRSKWRWGGYVIAAIVAAERVAENAHWLSDTIAAAALGIAGVHLIRWLLAKLMRAGQQGASPVQ